VVSIYQALKNEAQMYGIISFTCPEQIFYLARLVVSSNGSDKNAIYNYNISERI
jgi:hypothetical protein